MDRHLNVTIERDVPAVMRDGTTLYADVYRPADGEPHPVILVRLPYDKAQAMLISYAHPVWYAQHGYIVVMQDTRGRYASQGDFYPFKYEMTDGYDSVEWAAALPGSNGKVGMYGFSYVGATQLLAAVMKPPHLTCIVPGLTGSQYYDGWTYNGGALALSFALSWSLNLSMDTAHRRQDAELEAAVSAGFPNTASLSYMLPLTEFGLLKDSDIAPYFFDWLAHPTYDDYWKQWSIDSRYDQIEVPALHFGGWYDIFRDGVLKNFNGIQQSGGNEIARDNQKLVVGPWYHIPWSQHTGQIDFGAEAHGIFDDLQLRWFDYWLKGIDNGVIDEPRVRLFLMGDNRWLEADTWPLPNTQETPFYLHSGGRANSLEGDGRLSRDVPGDEAPDINVFDPHYPTPSFGGHSCCFPHISPMGPADQRPVEVFHTVLVYTSDVLENDLTIAGNVTATLWATSSTVDADFTVKLVDVYPDGRAINLTEGILRARYRDSLEVPELLQPDEVYQLTLAVGNTCNVFKAGHRIRVEVAHSNFPHWDRNTNTGNVPAADTYSDMQVSQHLIFHDHNRPSHITLPVVEGL